MTVLASILSIKPNFIMNKGGWIKNGLINIVMEIGPVVCGIKKKKRENSILIGCCRMASWTKI